MKLKRPLRGSETGADVRMVQRALNKWAAPAVAIPVTSTYDQTTRDRMVAFQLEQYIRPASGFMGQATLDRLWAFFDAYGRMRYRQFRVPSPIPKLGPVTKGGRPLLEMSLTHKSSGLPTNAKGVTLWPAVDTAWGAGVAMYAPENCVVDTKDSSARPGEALYMTGTSKLRYWFAHLDRDHPLGTRLKKGAFLGKTVPTTLGGGPHGHVAVNAEAYLGQGQQFKYGRTGTGPDYTLGAPTMRAQLEAILL